MFIYICIYIYICVYLALPDPKVATKWTFCDYVYVHILYNHAYVHTVQFTTHPRRSRQCGVYLPMPCVMSRG